MLNLEGSVSGWLRRSHPYRFVLARTLVDGERKALLITEDKLMDLALLSLHTTDATTNQPLDKLFNPHDFST